MSILNCINTMQLFILICHIYIRMDVKSRYRRSSNCALHFYINPALENLTLKTMKTKIVIDKT